MSKVIELKHPLLQHKLTLLRDRETGVKDFRELTCEIAMLMCYEATRDLPLEEVEIETPMAKMRSNLIAGKKLTFVPILRAGLGMVDGMLSLIPKAKTAHIGVYRDPDSLLPVEYFCKTPQDISKRDAIILDPMLATGGSAAMTSEILEELGARSIKLICILAAPPGVEKMQREHPNVDIFTCCIDPELDSHGYIVPGLGDAGDRLFGTK